MKQQVFIIANSDSINLKFLQNTLDEHSFIICCDGAANTLVKAGRVPDIIIGDLDSVTKETQKIFDHKTKVICEPSQYKCDLEKALDYCLEQDFKNVNLLGLDGGRADYAIANFIVLKHYCEKLNLTVLAKDYTAFPIVSGWQKKCVIGQRLSFIPFGQCEGISMVGVKYELDQTVMKLGDIGVSNEVSKEKVTIDIASGYACIFLFYKK